MVAVLGYSSEQIFSAVKQMYTAVARAPESGFHFPVGRSACRSLGYPEELLDGLPESALESFAGVGCPFRANLIQPGDRVLDIGAGAGVDSLIASRLVGVEGRVIALDLTPAMAGKLRDAATQMGADNIIAAQASAEQLNLPDESLDVITCNGALNLVPDKRRAIAEMFRVLRPGGGLQIADVVIRRPVTVDCNEDPRLWVECVVGATVREDLLSLFEEAGFEQIEILGSHDYFALSSSPQTREIAASFDAHALELRMRRAANAPPRWWQWWRRYGPGRWLTDIWRRGFAGTFALVLALLACYGTLAAVVLLPLAGVGLVLNQTAWAGTISAFTLLTALATLAGFRRHRAYGPSALALLGMLLVHYALFVDYWMPTELTGFVFLAAGVIRDLWLRRRREQRLLGISRNSR